MSSSSGAKVKQQEIDARKRLFERELKQWESDGDPLTPWVSYLEWLEDKGLKRHDSYKGAIQKCMRYFASMPDLSGEVRLAKIYIKAANICKDPVAIYKHMQDHGIGTKFAPYYRAYSMALVDKGNREEAIRVVGSGMKHEARPLNMLQEVMVELKSGKGGSGRATAVHVMDEKSERNKAFYSQPGINYCYQKQLVYPPTGGELSLEQIRANLPQYIPAPQDGSGECDMEMTVAVTGHITMHVPVVPSLFKPGKELAASRPGRSTAESFEVYHDENEHKQSFSAMNRSQNRKPLGLVSHHDLEVRSGHKSTSPEDELDLMMAEKDNDPLEIANDPPQSSRKKRISDEDVDRELEQLMLEKEQDTMGGGVSMNQELAGDIERRDGFGKELFGGDNQTAASNQLGSAYQEKPSYRQTDEFGTGWSRGDNQSSTQPNQFRAALLTQSVAHSESAGLQHAEGQSEGVGQSSVGAPEVQSMRDESLSRLVNQENVVHSWMERKNRFDFTPGTMADVDYKPTSGEVSQLKTRLNFSESEHSVHGKSGLETTASSSMAMFNTTLDCEKRAKLTDEQLMFEKEFANTEFHDGPLYPASEPSYQPPSLINETSQSFDVFHDSWNVSAKTNSQMRGRSAFSKPDITGSKPVATEKRKPLQELPRRVPLQVLANPQEPFIGDYSLNSYSKHSIQPSQTAESFSVFEDTTHDQSSLAPYHDSWAGTSRNKSGLQLLQHSVNTGAPVMRGNEMEQTMDQSFTQFDIPRPKQSAPSSTPAGHKKIMHHDFTLDLSVIPPNQPTIYEPNPPSKQPPSLYQVGTVPQQRELESVTELKKCLPRGRPAFEQKEDCPGQIGKHPDYHPTEHAQFVPHPGPLVDPVDMGGKNVGVHQVANLSTIMEVSENSRSSSRSTVSSGSSRFSSSSSSSSHQASTSHIMGCGPYDPFEPHIVNMMLNKVGVSDKIQVIKGPFPKLRSGCGLILGKEEFHSVSLLAEGGFAKVYLGKNEGTTKILKVQSPPLEWEVTVIQQLQSRLHDNNLHQAISSFISVEKAFRFDDTSVIVSDYHSYGSLLDLVNCQRSGQGVMSDIHLYYLTCEMVTSVATLHQCGIIHADIKPDNFMLRDFRMFSDVRSALGRGLCLVDFGRAIDLHVFPDDVMFVGSCKTDGVECPSMIEDKPWKWQVDYFGLGAAIYTLLTNSYMEISKNPESGLYRPNTQLPRKYRGLWTQILDLLLNATEALPLVELIQPIHSHLVKSSNSRVCDDLKRCFNQLLKYKK